MLIDVSELISKKLINKKVHLEFEKDPFVDRDEVIEFAETITLKGDFVRKDEFIDFNGMVETKLNLSCSRCLEKFVYDVNVEIEQSFAIKEDDKEIDVYAIKKENIDLDEVIENIISSELPIKRLCSEECKGLCSRCGVNLNKSNCSCQPSEEKVEEDMIDPRFAKLKNLFNDNK